MQLAAAPCVSGSNIWQQDLHFVHALYRHDTADPVTVDGCSSGFI